MDPLYPTGPGFMVPFHDPASRGPSTPFPLNGVDLDTVSDEEIIAAGKVSPVIYSLWSTKIVRLSTHLVLKYGAAIQMQEIEAMKCVLLQTKIATPRLHRYFFTADDSESSKSRQCGYIVMDYVEGNTVFEIWESLSLEKRTAIVKQVAGAVSQLQAIRFDRPGPLGEGGECRGFWFSDYGAGPFNNKDDFNKWFTHKLEVAKQFGQASKDLPPFNYSSFVLVHHDLNPKNLIVDRSGKVWIIDWGNAGAYPAIFESAIMNDSSRFKEFNAYLLPQIYNNLEERNHLMGVLWTSLSAPCQ